MLDRRNLGNLMNKTVLSNIEKAEGAGDQTTRQYCGWGTNNDPVTWNCKTTGITTKGFSSLSNDLLLCILGAVSICAVEWRTVLYLSWVSRRFRDTTLLLPRMWAFLSTEMEYNLEIVNLFIRRSGTEGLTVLLDDCQKYPEDFFLMVTRPSVLVRWERLILAFRTQNYPNHEMVSRLTNGPNIVWPRLQSLDMTHSFAPMNRYILEKVDENHPHLRSMSLDCRIFPPRRLPNSVTHLRIAFECYETACLQYLWEMMESSPNVQVAEITLFIRKWDEPINPSMRIPISNLRVLRVHVAPFDTSHFWKMYFPALRDLHISFHNCSGGAEMSYADAVLISTGRVFNNSNILPSLERLSLDVGESPTSDKFRRNAPPVAFFGKFLKVCPKLQDFEIYCGGEFEAFDLPPLRSLRLRGMDFKCTKWLFQYLDSVKEKMEWGSLQEFALLACSLSEEDKNRLQEYGDKIYIIKYPDYDDRWRQKIEVPLRSLF